MQSLPDRRKGHINLSSSTTKQKRRLTSNYKPCRPDPSRPVLHPPSSRNPFSSRTRGNTSGCRNRRRICFVRSSLKVTGDISQDLRSASFRRGKGDTYRPWLVLPQRYSPATVKGWTLPTWAQQTHSPASTLSCPSSRLRPPSARGEQGSRRRNTVRLAVISGRSWPVLPKGGRRGGHRFRGRRVSGRRWGGVRIGKSVVRHRPRGRRCLNVECLLNNETSRRWTHANDLSPT